MTTLTPVSLHQVAISSEWRDTPHVKFQSKEGARVLMPILPLVSVSRMLSEALADRVYDQKEHVIVLPDYTKDSLSRFKQFLIHGEIRGTDLQVVEIGEIISVLGMKYPTKCVYDTVETENVILGLEDVPDIRIVVLGEQAQQTIQSEESVPEIKTEKKVGKMHVCQYCSKAFRQRSVLREHIRLHTGERPYKCNECGRCFTQGGSLRKHQRIHTGDRPFQCKECNQTFVQGSGLAEHMRLHTGDRPYSCPQCTRTFRQRTHLRLHLVTHSGRRDYQCPHCKKDFAHKRNMVMHSASCTARENKLLKTETDDIEDSASENAIQGSVDDENKEDEFQCKICKAPFSVEHALKSHMQVHTPTKKFVCQYCKKAFSQNSILKEHERLHTGEKPFTCDICGKSFTQRGPLTIHKRLHTGERPYKCTVCFKTFRQKTHLVHHSVIHTGKRDHFCHYCNKDFAHKQSMRHHMQRCPKKLSSQLQTVDAKRPLQSVDEKQPLLTVDVKQLEDSST